MKQRRGRAALTAWLGLLVLGNVTACGSITTAGQAVTQGEVAGLPVTHFESGRRSDAPIPKLDVENATSGEIDRLAIATIADVTAYWTEQMPERFGQDFRPLSRLLSYDSTTDDIRACDSTTRGLVNAFFCAGEDLVAWDRGVLLPLVHDKYGPIAIVTVLAHEYGHALQFRLGDKAGISKTTKSIVKELQADCFTGNYFRYLAEGKSPYFTVSTSEGINAALSALYWVRDAPGALSGNQGAHGTAFDRTYAFQLGFEKGPQQCAAIDAASVAERTTQQKFSEQDIESGKGDARIDEQTLGLVQESLAATFESTGAQLPVVVGGSACPNGASTPPVSYCPDTNAVTVDLPALGEVGEPIDMEAERRGKDSAGRGDFAAFASVASRYALAVQKAGGAKLDDANTGLRSACLVGAWAGAANRPRPVDKIIRLSPGDLDEAILEMLQPKSLIASDVNGIPVPNGFARIEALRIGYNQGVEPCGRTFS
ncbi:MAG: neutral zinc metallopeptidase [Haloechinothrix sp.]